MRPSAALLGIAAAAKMLGSLRQFQVARACGRARLSTRKLAPDWQAILGRGNFSAAVNTGAR